MRKVIVSTISAGIVLIFTNNPLVSHHYPEARYLEGPPLKVLLAARDAVHRGHRLLLHPVLGNLLPHRGFFRSIVLTGRPEGSAEPASIALLENTLEVFRDSGPPPSPPERVTADLQTIDFELLTTGLHHLRPSRSTPQGRTSPCA
ncbi:MAG: GrdX family protein [Candidatus Tectimicrobiota bacterium]